MDLFSSALKKKYLPLAVRMRPEILDDFFGQEEVIGKGSLLRRLIEADKVPSILVYGPPGTGKTTLAKVIAHYTGAEFIPLNAVASGIADIKKVVKEAKDRLSFYEIRTILFIDEIHRFNKSQQDALLPYVEEGTVILIGATTENPYFEVNAPLLSRLRVIPLKTLSKQAVKQILVRALTTDVELALHHFEYDDKALDIICDISNGDGRIALNILEYISDLLIQGHSKPFIDIEIVKESIGEKALVYDKHGDNHYDVVSAFIKSMRGSDPDAAIHYLARMLVSGEDINFIARRIVICAAEDVGLADPNALVLATSTAQAVHLIGMPEARIPLAEAVIYVATAPKSNSAYLAINQAMDDVKNIPIGFVPLHLRDASYFGANKLGHGSGYKYPHNYSNAYVEQQYLPDELQERNYYQSTNYGQEVKIQECLRLRKVTQSNMESKK